MNNLDLEKISEAIGQKLNKNIEIISAEPMGSGYHSDGFILKQEEFFIKKIKSNDLGFELPERKIYSLLVSNEMSKRNEHNPKGIGIMIENNQGKIILPDINENTEIYHIQNVIPGLDANSKNYWQMLLERKNKKEIDSQDITELEKITDLIADIHVIKYSSSDEEYLKRIYNDGLRSIITNPELTFTLLQYFSEENKILPREKHAEYVGLMLKNVYKWEDRSDRLCALHGDFWGTNLYFTKKGTFLIDFSRIPWGDPGIDIGFWIAQYVWFFYETGNLYFKDLLDKFLANYIKKTSDNEIRETVCLSLGLMGIIYTNPKFYPNINEDIAKKFMDNMWKILKEQKFTW